MDNLLRCRPTEVRGCFTLETVAPADQFNVSLRRAHKLVERVAGTPALLLAADALVKMLIGRGSYNGNSSCTVCHKEASTPGEIFHVPSCRVGQLAHELEVARGL